MGIMFDTADLQAIRHYKEILPFCGVTSNPSILKAAHRLDFFTLCRELRQEIGMENSLHIQVTARDYEGILREAETLCAKVDDQVFIKVPVTEQGLRAIKTLKSRQIHVTATAIYNKTQAILAAECGADFAAPYFNRMQNMDIDACREVAAVRSYLDRNGLPTQILAASFKNLAQVHAALESGAHVVTAPPELFVQALCQPAVTSAVDAFGADWVAVYGDRTIDTL